MFEPTQGYLWDLGKRKVKFRSKKTIFGVIFFLRSLDLLWESATPPTHIWENFPKNTFYFLGGSHHKSQITKKHAIDETIKIANAIHLPKLFEYILILTPGAGQKRSPFTNHPAWPKGHKRPVRLFSWKVFLDALREAINCEKKDFLWNHFINEWDCHCAGEWRYAWLILL